MAERVPETEDRPGVHASLRKVRSDFELLVAWGDGDDRAGNELFERHFDAAFRFFRNKVGDDASDLVQQTFSACVQSRSTFRRDASFRTYLFAVARNKLYDFLRQKQRTDARLDFGVSSILDLGLSPSDAVVAQENHKLLLHGLRCLPVELQLTLELYYVEQLRGPALSEVLGVPMGTVRSRIRRGLERLKVAMLELEASPERVETTLSDLDHWAAGLRENPPA